MFSEIRKILGWALLTLKKVKSPTLNIRLIES